MKLAKKAILLLVAIWLITPGLFSQTVGITGDSTVNQCETKTYTVSIQNTSGNPLTGLVITALLENFTGFSYVSGTSSIDVNGGGAFCTANPAVSGGYAGTCLPAPSAPYLTWDIDAQCPGSPFTLNNGDTLNITFDLETDCTAVSGSLNTYIDYRISGTPFCDNTGAHSIQVLPGGVTIKKTPNVIPQELGQNVTWTLTIENTGFGIIENVVVTDVLGAGLAFVSSTPAGDNSGQTTTWDSSEIAGLASMNAGDIITIDITATVIACEELENNADVRWGCDMVTDCYNTADTLPPSTATASVQRIVKTPLIEYTPPDVSFNYCEDFVDVNFTITNTGDGRAHDVWLYVDFGTLAVSNLSAAAIYNNIAKRFELANPLDGAPGPGNTYNLGFRLNFNTWCAGSFSAGDLLWQTQYKDECDNDFFPPVNLSTINQPAGSSSLSVGKTGAPTAIQIGGQINYIITSSYSGPMSCGSGPGTTGDITVVDTIPNGFTVELPIAGGGVWVDSGDGTGGTITWTYTPPASLNTGLILNLPDATQCETYCFTTFTNNIQATGTDCCGCALSGSASQTTAIECEELVDSEKTAVPAAGIRCDTIQYTNTYIFEDTPVLDTVDISQFVFQEDADSEQEYVPGSLSVTLSGTGDITACALSGLTDSTPGAGGNLSINFSGCSAPVRNQTLIISYQLTITENTVGACNGATFYSWSTLDMNLSSGSECLPDGEIHETTTVSVEAPSMSLSITGLGQIIHQCESQTITITLSQTSGTADPKDVRLVLSGLNYYVVNPAATICSGAVSPTSCTPAIIGDDYVWYFDDGFTAGGQAAVLQLQIQKRCTGSGDLVATAYFDDNCNDDTTYNDSCSVSGTETPALLLSGDLLIEKNPEVIYASTNSIQWKIYLTNRGNGTAYNVWLDDELGSGLDYAGAVVDNMTGVTVTADQDHDANAINGCTIAIAQMAAGERREITFDALLINCTNLTNDVSASWGCVGVECQTEVTDNATVEIPRPLLINTNVVTTPSDACSDPDGSITLRNAGQTTCYNLQITENLPTGLSYIPGSTRWQVNGGGWNGPNAAYDPVVSGSPEQLVWTSTEIAGLAVSNPGDTIEIKYDLEADCPFAGGDVTVATSYENPCGQVFNTANSTFTVAFREPQVTITKTRINEPIDCGDIVEWTIAVANTSGYTLPIIWVEDTIGASYTYQSSVGDPPFTSDNGTFDGTNTIAWELRNVNHNDTVVLTLRATADNPPCSANLDNTAIAWWGCGAADGSSATKPGVDPPDDTDCLAAAGVSDTNTPTREPSMSFLDISLNPVSIDSCNDNTQLTVTIENTGPTDAENVDLVITLPAGISYNAGSSAVTCGGVTGPAADPTVAGNQLTYYDITDNAAGKANNLCDTVQASGGNDTLVLVFSINSDCYVTADVSFDLYYYDCCEDTRYSTNDSETLTALYPDLSITKTPVNSQVDCNANQTWTINVTNNGTGNAQVVLIEDTLGDWIDYVSSAPAATAMGGQLYGWEINNLAASGGTQTFTITGQLNPDAPQSDCTALLRQNNVRTIWGCGTTGDAVDGDPGTTGYDCTHDTWSNAPAALLQMPDLVVTAITPDITCTSEGNFSGSITVTVQNQGDGNSVNTFTVEITDGKGWTGAGTYSANVGPGASVDVTIDVTTWAPDCQPCAVPYNFNVTNVDLGDAVCECNEGNNTFGPVAYVTPIPDLVVSDIDFSNVSCTTDNISGTVDVIIRNNGCAAATNFEVSLSTDGCLSFSNETVASLAAETSTTISFAISGSWADCTVQNCQFTAEVDPTGAVCECDGGNNDRVETYSTTLPDLIVTDIDFSSITCAADNFSGFVSVTVQNRGLGSAIGFQVSLATDGCLSFANQTVLVPVGAGGSTTVIFPITPPWVNCGDCNCDFTATVDPTNAVCECDGSNNQLAESYTQNLPDLRVNSVTPAVNCIADGNLQGTVTVNVENIGCGDANNAVVRLISTCGIVFVDQTVNLAVGSSSNLTFNFTPDCSACTCIFIALIDPDSLICECSGANNAIASAPYTINVPDITVQADTLALTCSGSDQVMVSGTVTLANPGCGLLFNATVPMRFTLYDNTGCAGNVIDQWTQNFTPAIIFPGGGTQAFAITPRTINSNLCNNSTGCQVSIYVEADYSNMICECDGTNNTYCADNKNVDIPDIEVSGDTLGVTCFDDGQVTVSGTFTLANNGCGSNLNSNVPMRFTLYDNTGCAGSVLDQWTQTMAAVNIPAGGGTQVFAINPRIVTSDLATNSTGCRVSIRVEADYTNAVCECDDTDNTYCADNKNVDIPDIEMTGDTLSVDCLSDGQVTVSGTVTVANNGCGSNLGSNIPVRFTLYDNTGCAGNQINQWTDTLTGVNIPAGGGTQILSITPHNITTDMVVNSTACRVSILMEADYSDTICESDGTDNTFCSDKTISIPDLTVNSVTPSASCIADGNVQGIVTVNVGNTGCAAANGAVVSLTSDCGLVFADQTVNLSAGGNTDLIFNFIPTAANCTCVFTATIDPADAICESDGTDNTATSAPNTLNVPDIEVQTDSFAVNCSSDGQVTVSGTVTFVNNGCGTDLTDDIPVRFTIFDNTGCAGNQVNQWTETLTGVTIPSGGGTQTFTITPQTVTANMVANSTGCQVSIYVEADHTGTICEFDGFDNAYCADNKVVDIADLEVQTDTLTLNCFADGQITISGAVTMLNNGCGSNLTNNVPVRFTLYDNTGCAGNQLSQWTETFAGVNIPAGGGAQTFTITPQNLTSNMVDNSTNCRVSMLVEVDYTNNICESDGTDNSYCADNIDIDIPDIEVSGDALDIDCTDDGQYSISGTVTMNNNGCGSNLTADIPVRFTLYDNSGCAGNIVTQWTETLSAVNIPAGGGTQTFTITAHNAAGNLCADSSSCAVSILIEADYPGTICESDGTDNTLCSAKTVAIPNLTVDAVATSITCVSDGNLTGTDVTVTNNGCGPAPGVVVRLSSDCGLTFTDQTIDLAAGETRTLLFTFTAGITTCSCNFTAEIDPDNTICECDGTDNTMSSLTDMLIPDLEVQSEALLISCSDDGVVQVTGTIALVNNGCGPNLTDNINMRFSLYGNTGCSGNLLHQWTETFTGTSIPSAGGSQTFTIQPHDININFCTDSTNCQVSLFIETDYDDSICEWDGTDNTYCTDKTSDCIDVEAVSVSVDTRCRADGNITGTIRVNINNSGGNPITQDFSILVDDDRGWSSELRYNADLGGILPLPAGDSYEAAFDWNRSFTNRNCAFNNIRVLVDSQNEICQCSTANDTLTTTYRLRYPNLLPTAISANCSGDGFYSVQVTVENNGCGSAEKFILNLTDNHGNSKDISVAGLTEGDSVIVEFLQWPALCAANSISFTARVDSNEDVCELDGQDQILDYLLPGGLPDLIVGDIDWICNPDGTIAFTIIVSNQGEDSANNVPVTIYDHNDNLIYNQTVNLPAGATEQLSFTTQPFAKNIDHTFRFVVDGTLNICECDGGNNEKSITVNCPGGEDESPLQIEKICPPGQQPGGLFRFEIRIWNSGPVDLAGVTIEDFLPEGFQYVAGSSALDGQIVPDPQIGDSLSWQIGTLQPGQKATLIFSAVADSDIDPGRYCNEVKGSAGVPGSTAIINSPKVQCCTVVSREANAGCCLDVEEWPMGFFHKPEAPISFIEPYFHTESAMFTAYAIFNLWENAPLKKGGMPLFMKERLRNYARSTVEEFYFNSRSGLTLPDGTLKHSFAGAYPEQDEKARDKQGWLRKQVDNTMTLSQLGYELLALNETRKVETESKTQQKLALIINGKLDFLNDFLKDLPHSWEINETNNKNGQEVKVKELAEKASLYDKASLYLSMVELAKDGNEKAKNFTSSLREMLKTIDNRDFDPRNLRAEMIFTLALIENEEGALAAAKVLAFETLYKKRIENSQKDGEKEMLSNLHDYALSAALAYKTGASIYPELIKRMKEKYYLNDTGIFADKQPDFTFKLTLRSLAAMILCFDTKENDLDHNATVLYRTFDEVGLFLKKRNLVIGKPLYSLLKNYPFSEPLLPVLSFTKAKRSVAPVFSQDAVVHSTRVKPTGEILIPHDFSKILSPSYETRTSRIAAISFGLQYFGKELMKSSLRVIKEEGRSMKDTGKKYLDSLLQSGAGILFNGSTLLPFDHIAIKGPNREKQNLEPLNSGVKFSTGTLADYLLAEKSYLDNDGSGAGQYADSIPGLLAAQARIVEKFADFGYIPLSFSLFETKGESFPSYTLIPVKEQASKITAAKLYHALQGEKIGTFLETILKKMNKSGELRADDLIFLSSVPGLLPYFKEELRTLIDLKDSDISLNSADIIARRLLGMSNTDGMKKSMENLRKNWDKEAVLPKSDRIENIEKGLIYHHEPKGLLLYLMAVNNPEDFRFKRTLNFFTYLLENEWGVEWQKTFMTLPSAEYLVFREEPREKAEPGDLINFRVRVDNTCPEGYGSAWDIPELYLKSRFTPPLIYTGTQPVEGLLNLGDFQWRYNGFPEGSVLEYIYQAYIPAEFRYDYIDGSIYAGGRQGYMDFGLNSAAGDNCQDIDQVERFHFVPLTPLNGLVFEDKNVNGIKDVGEPGIPNILIKDTRGRLFRSDADGRFIVLAGASYEGVQIELKSLPYNYLLNAKPTQLVNRNFAGDIYFSLIPTKTVSGFVFIDENGSGVYDNGEKRPMGVLLQAKDKEVFTGQDGEFIFRNLPELWRQWIKIKPEQPYYKGSTTNLKININ
jgi:uncharacterized repeat protein (TIGR01451 family)